MNQGTRVAQSGSFVASEAGRRFRLVSEPTAREPRGTVVFVHGFAEEMNKSRRMAARMARLLAGDGWRVVQRDLRGCGDSSGDFGDATWTDWVHDVEAELSAAIPHRPVWLWGLRAGALLAATALAKDRRCHLLLWQPVVNGAQHLQQFLRLHAGARIVGVAKDEPGLSPMQVLRSGRSVEVGGYALSPALASGLESAKFELPEPFAGRVVWLEVSTAQPPEMPPSSARAVEALTARGRVVESEVLNGPPFWLTQEIEECELLLERTRARLAMDDRSGAEATTPPAAPGVMTEHDVLQ